MGYSNDREPESGMKYSDGAMNCDVMINLWEELHETGIGNGVARRLAMKR